MPGPLRISKHVEIPEAELNWRFSRSGGPGGQSVNTSNSRVELWFDLAQSTGFPPFLLNRALQRLEKSLVDGVITIVASEHRSQYQNRLAAERRLVDVLAQAISPPPPTRRPTKPTKSSSQARVDDKRHRGQIKQQRKFKEDE